MFALTSFLIIMFVLMFLVAGAGKFIKYYSNTLDRSIMTSERLSIIGKGHTVKNSLA